MGAKKRTRSWSSPAREGESDREDDEESGVKRLRGNQCSFHCMSALLLSSPFFLYSIRVFYAHDCSCMAHIHVHVYTSI